jgi:sugar lactone lactonase YvrE
MKLNFILLASSILCTKILTPPFLLAQSDVKIFHEGPIYDPDLGIVLISSDVINNTDKHHPQSSSTVLDLASNNLTSFNSLFTKVPYANGGIRLSSGKYIICGQGDYDRKAGLYLLNPHTMKSTPLLTSYNNSPFNSPNDIVLYKNHVYFTDPDYGFKQGFRRPLKNKASVYRGRVDLEREMVVDVERILGDFDKPNGIAVSPNGLELLVTDSGCFGGDGTVDYTRPRDIYVWDMNRLDQDGRLVFQTTVGIPDGIKFDSQGRLWVANYGGEGILQVDYKTGEIKAKIGIVNGSSANFAFVEFEGREEMIIMGDNSLWRHDLKDL